MVVTQEYHRVFSIDRGLGTEYVKWTAWMEPYPMIRGYGRTEAEAKSDLASHRPRKEVDICQQRT